MLNKNFQYLGILGGPGKNDEPNYGPAVVVGVLTVCS